MLKCFNSSLKFKVAPQSGRNFYSHWPLFCFRLDFWSEFSFVDLAEEPEAAPVTGSPLDGAPLRHDDVQHPVPGQQEPVRRGQTSQPDPAAPLAPEG